MTVLSLTGLDAMASLLLDFGGMDAVERRALGLSAQIRASLQEHGHTVLSDPDPARASGIISVEIPDSAEFCEFCETRNIWVLRQKPTDQGKQAVRVSTHFFNNEDDIDTFTEVMDEFRYRPAQRRSLLQP